jgi:hypothetical protein
MWGDDGQSESNKTGVGLAYIPPAKPKLPGHEQSYNPPAEYLPTEVRGGPINGDLIVMYFLSTCSFSCGNLEASRLPLLCDPVAKWGHQCSH